MIKVITCNDWSYSPIDNPEYLDYRYIISFNEWEALKIGLAPLEMENKWFLFLEENTIYCCQSWTGNCIFTLETKSLENGNILLYNATSTTNKELYNITENQKTTNLTNLILMVINYNKIWLTPTLQTFLKL